MDQRMNTLRGSARRTGKRWLGAGLAACLTAPALSAIAALAALAPLGAAAVPAAAAPLMVLSYNKPGNFNHANAIAAFKDTLSALGTAKGFTVVQDDEGTELTPIALKKYQVVILNNNVSLGNAMTPAQQTAFSAWMSDGGGAVGIHGAMDHRDRWDWFSLNMAKTRFASHSSWGANEQAKVQVDPESTPAEYAGMVAVLPKVPWVWRDEWYSFTINPRPNVDVLITVNENTFTPNPAMGGDHPVAWALKLPPGPSGKPGRFLYTAHGHESLCFADPLYRDFLYQAILWASGTGTTGIGGAPGPVGAAGAAFTATPRISAGTVSVEVTGKGRHEVEITGLSGRRMAYASGFGPAVHSFSALQPGRVYWMVARSGKIIINKRIMP